MYINVNNLNLFYHKSGGGAPLILLHGNSEDHHIFDALAAKLQNHFTIYALDSRNHGHSDSNADYSYASMAMDVRAFIQALDLAPVNIIGFSDGAIISLLLALTHGNVLNKMALLGVNLKPSDLNAKSYQYIKTTYEQTKNPLFKLMLEEPNIELDEVRGVSTPTLLIAAEREIYRPELFSQLAASLPQAKLKIMLGHNHESYIVGKDILYHDFISFFTKA